MDKIFIGLSKAIADRTFFNVDEVAGMIKVHFELWQSKISNDDIFKSNIAKKRNALIYKFRTIELEKNIVEKQVLTGKSKLREGKYVDTEWLARANFALRIKKAQMRAIQEDLSTIKAVEKAKNIKDADTETRKVKNKIAELLKDRIGEEETVLLFQEAGRLVKEEF